MKKQLGILLMLCWMLSACIQDDIIFDTVLETFRITNRIDTLGLGDTFSFETRYTNNIGEVASPTISWSSSDDNIASVNANGAVTGIALGAANIYAKVLLANNTAVGDTLPIIVASETTDVASGARSGSIAATSSYNLKGDFTLTQAGDDLILDFASNYEASQALPGLYVYLTNNPNTISGALEIGKVTTFAGAHDYTIEDVDVSKYDYVLYFCKPFRVKVGDGVIND